MSRFAQLSKPKKPLFTYELVDLIQPFDVEERRAFLFAAISGLPIDTVAKMTRSDFANYWGEVARFVVESQVPHIKCDSLFWRFRGDGSATPLFGLGREFERMVGMSWGSYMSQFSGLIHYWRPEKDSFSI